MSLPNSSHYLFFRHDTASLTASDFDITLYKNGTFINSIEIELEQEADSGDTFMYKAYFTDDGTSPCVWDLVITDDSSAAVSDTNPTHQGRFIVEAPIDRQLLQRIRGGREY